MTGKRKRTRPGKADEGDQKRQKIALDKQRKDPIIKSAVLRQFYPQVLTLRQFLLFKLPLNSKVRSKKIRNVGRKPTPGREMEDQGFSEFLDQTLVGLTKETQILHDERWKQWDTFSQRAEESASTLANLSGLGAFCQTEIVDFAIWQLFSIRGNNNGRILHLLCQGFRRDAGVRDENGPSAIPGITVAYPNSHVNSIKAMPWPRVLALWGNEGERAMIDLLLDCGVFLLVPGTQGVYNQLSGQPLGEMKVLPLPGAEPSKGLSSSNKPLRTASAITFVRNRMLYARAALNAQGGVRFGLRHIHVLNRYPVERCSGVERKPQQKSGKPSLSTIHTMMYMFPRQFGLHNVFTENVDTRQTVQPFQDYTLREDEINRKFSDMSSAKVPRRLRGKGVELVEKLQLQHFRCSYKKLLDHYCPVSILNQPRMAPLPHPSPTSQPSIKTQPTMTSSHLTPSNRTLPPRSEKKIPRKESMMDHSTPVALVSAFCRAVFTQLVPIEFWGAGEIQTHNERNIHQNIDRFIKLRRFESLSLHEVTQGLKIKEIDWLGCLQPSQKNLPHSDINKRWEIFNELIYYLFDSLLIPLIRSNFHVTESNIHRYRLFYFRHDVWKSIAEPALASLKLSMFEEVKFERARRILASRTLGFSQVRLLPKETGVRPIMNLRRRAIKKNSNFLGSSINSVLAPVYNILTYEKTSNPARLGSTLFSVGELYSRLKTFKSSQNPSKAFYFAKLDVKSAFDTIPQAAVVKLISSITTEDEYRISKHLEMKPGEDFRSNDASKPVRKWAALAHSLEDLDTFDEALETDLAPGKKNTIFVENVVNQRRSTGELLRLLSEHITNNMVKIGKKFYRQKEGIPQGSVLSSLLCNYFYADLEAKHLGFLNDGESLLLRLIDDFLLVTTNREHAKMFLQIMHRGVPEYGVRVNPDKSLTNFEARIEGKKVTRLVGSRSFPYCGSFIDTKSLNIRKDRERRRNMDIGDSLTIEFSKTPGKAFHRKVLNAFKIQAHAMFLDTSFNSLATVLSNIFSAFVETANKTWTYAKCLPVGKQPGTELMIKTISDLADLAFVLLKSKGKNRKNTGYKCAVSKVQVEWLAINAFKSVLGKRQSKYVKVLEWLGKRIVVLSVKEREMCLRSRCALRVERDEDGY